MLWSSLNQTSSVEDSPAAAAALNKPARGGNPYFKQLKNTKCTWQLYNFFLTDKVEANISASLCWFLQPINLFWWKSSALSVKYSDDKWSASQRFYKGTHEYFTLGCIAAINTEQRCLQKQSTTEAIKIHKTFPERPLSAAFGETNTHAQTFSAPTCWFRSLRSTDLITSRRRF